MTLGPQHPMPETRAERRSFKAGWPNKVLWPNNRKAHRWTKDARNSQKQEWHVEAIRSRIHGRSLKITFHPPDEKRRDLDNMLSACKSGLDGLSSAVGIDDSEFTLTITKGAVRRPHGCVVVEVQG